MTATRFVIRRLRLAFETPSAGSSRDVAQEAAAALRAGLADRIAARFSERDDDGRVLLIRRVDVDLDFAVGEPLDTLVDRVVAAIGLAVAKARETGAAALIIENQARFTTAFLVALLDGEAWNSWWFRGFQGLRALSVGAAVRTALSRDWGSAVAVLSACPQATRAILWDRLEESDARTILSALASDSTGAPRDEDWPILVDAVLESPSRSVAVAALAAVIEVAATTGRREIGGVIAVARLLAHSRGKLQERLAVARALADPQARETHGRPPHLGALPEPLLRAAARRLEAAGASDAGVGRWRVSPLMGFALLLPFLDPLAVNDDDWPDPAHGASATGLLRLLVLSACAGSSRRLWRDPFWRDFFGAPGALDDAAIAVWGRNAGVSRWRSIHVDPAASVSRPLPRALAPGTAARRTLGAIAGAALAAFAGRLPGFAGASHAFLRDNLLCAGGAALLDRRFLRVRLARPPLDVMLGMTGLADREVDLADGRRLMLERAP